MTTYSAFFYLVRQPLSPFSGYDTLYVLWFLCRTKISQPIVKVIQVATHSEKAGGWGDAGFEPETAEEKATKLPSQERHLLAIAHSTAYFTFTQFAAPH